MVSRLPHVRVPPVADAVGRDSGRRRRLTQCCGRRGLRSSGDACLSNLASSVVLAIGCLSWCVVSAVGSRIRVPMQRPEAQAGEGWCAVGLGWLSLALRLRWPRSGRETVSEHVSSMLCMPSDRSMFERTHGGYPRANGGCHPSAASGPTVQALHRLIASEVWH